MNERPAIIAVLGLCGVGKSEVTRLICEKHGYSVVYFGGQITNEVARRGMPPGADSERSIREELRKEHGMDAIARLAETEVVELLTSGNRVAIDGVYSYAEITYMTESAGISVLTIAVHSRKALRYQRMAYRPVRPLTEAQVDERDFREVQALDKARPIALADFHIVNDGTIGDLEESVHQALVYLEPSIFSIVS